MTLICSPNAFFPQDSGSTPTVIEIPAPPAPPGFDTTLWTLLQDIKTAGVALKGKIAEYAGFYHRSDASGVVQTLWDATTDNKNNPDAAQQPTETATGQPNKSLDKLTFLIMFRLPFRTSNPSLYYGDPINGAQTSWSYRANQLRTGALRRLNQAGEQVNASNQRCDDSGALLDDSSTGELNTPTAYSYFNNIGSDLTGAVATAVKSQPLYLYLTVITEGAFSVSPGDTTLSVVQVPENIVGLMGKKDKEKTPPPSKRRREVEMGTYTTAGAFNPSTAVANFEASYTLDGAVIKKELTGAHANEYYVLPTNVVASPPKIYVRLKYDAEELGANGAQSLGVTVFEMEGLKIEQETVSNTARYYATYYTTNSTRYKFGFAGPGDMQFDNLAIVNRSGVTLGWGYDIGQGNREDYQYNINFKIWKHAAPKPAGTTEFTLRYKDRSAVISFDSQPKDVETALLSLLGLKEKPWPDDINKKGVIIKVAPRTITVTAETNAGDANYPKGWGVSIIRSNMDPKETAAGPYSDHTGTHGFFNIYSSNVFYQKDATHEALQPNIKLTPALEKDRYVLNTAASAAWAKFNTLLDNFFGGQDWRDPSHFTGATAQDIQDFERVLRGCYAIRRGNAFLPVFNQYSLMKKFKLPSVDVLFPGWITHFIKPKYYDAKAANLPADVKNRTNAAEKYVLTTIAYGGNLLSNDDLNEAIKTKDLTKLIAVVNSRNKGDTFLTRRTTITGKLKSQFKKHLYRNIEED